MLDGDRQRSMLPNWRPDMKFFDLKMKCALAIVVGGIFAAGPVLADKPAGKGKGNDEQKSERRDDDRKSHDGDERSGGQRRHFEDQHRAAVRDYYSGQYRGGRCPPGLAKKNNGCMPPGQARKWQMGRPLPRDVVYYEVPQELVVRIGPPPSGHRYVRVAGDILLIAIATGLVVDAIQDLGR
jgi:Ni/Co efflux regulator RcnB